MEILWDDQVPKDATAVMVHDHMGGVMAQMPPLPGTIIQAVMTCCEVGGLRTSHPALRNGCQVSYDKGVIRVQC